MMPGRVIALWSPPRSRSTVFYRAMLERGDVLALHEPFCNLIDFAETDIAGTTFTAAPQVVAEIREQSRLRPVFFKDTTEYRHTEALSDDWLLREVQHTFVIRRPDEIAASFFALKPEMRCEELGLEFLYEIYCDARAHSIHEPVVVDSDDFVASPGATMATYCATVGLPYLPESLHWRAEPRPEWRRSGRWHVDVSRSSHVGSTSRSYGSNVSNTPALAAFAAHHQPFYDELRRVRMVVDAGARARGAD